MAVGVHGSTWTEADEKDYQDRLYQHFREEEERKRNFVGTECPKCREPKLMEGARFERCLACGHEQGY